MAEKLTKRRVSNAGASLTKGVWWIPSEREGRRPDEILTGWFGQIEDDQQARYVAYKECRRLFAQGQGDWSDDLLGAMFSGELSQNELRSTIETLWAQVFKNKIVPSVAVSEADYDEWDRAKGYSRWLEGTFDEAKVFEDALPRAGLDALVYGTGCVKVLEEDDWEDEDVTHVRCERVSPRYLFVDRLEAKHGKPRTLIQKTHIDRWTLYSEYGEDFAGAYGTSEERLDGIKDATSNDDDDLGYSSLQNCDMVTVYEAWHLPSGPRKKDGRHVIWIRGCTLVDEEFTWKQFPFVFIRYGAVDEGFWGASAVQLIAPTQRQLDKLNKKIDDAQDVMGVPRIIVRRGANIVKAHVDDVPGGILEADDINGIRDWNAQAASPELYNERDGAPRKMRALLGVSDFESTAQVPQGMRDISGEFLSRLVDQGQARHAMFHRAYENAIVELALMFMMKAEELQKRGRKVVCMAPGDLKTSAQSVDFAEVHVDRRSLKLLVQPMSQLPQTFAGKVDAVAKLKNEAGLPLDPKTVLRMLQVPDLNGTTDMLVSDEECILKNCHHMVKTGKYVPPLPWDNLQLIVKITTQFINAYRLRDGADMNNVALLAQYIEHAIDLQKPPAAPAAPPGGEMPPPEGMPGAPPPMDGAPPPDMGGMPPDMGVPLVNQPPPDGQSLGSPPGGVFADMGMAPPM